MPAKLEALDFIIEVLKEHEKQLDLLCHKLDTLTCKLDKILTGKIHHTSPNRKKTRF
jgi:uncharacterized coiled-coil protein SlyX